MDRTIRLIQRCRQGDEHAREILVEENTGLVWCVARRFFHRGVEPDDLFQIGNIGLLKAIDKFDTSYDVKFSTYAVPMISGEIKRFLRDDGMIKVSRSLKELAYKACLGQMRMQERLGRDPTVMELSEELGVEVEDLTMAMEANYEIESLQKPVYQNDGQEVPLMDKLVQTEEEEEKLLDQIVLEQVLQKLLPEERKLIGMRYFSNYTQTQVGEELGISQVQVSRLEKKILNKMREYFYEKSS